MRDTPQDISVGPHLLRADEQYDSDCNNAGPNPYELLLAALTATISSPIQVHRVTETPARRAPRIGEHDEEVLKELVFTSSEIEGLRVSSTIPPRIRHHSRRTEAN